MQTALVDQTSSFLADALVGAKSATVIPDSMGNRVPGSLSGAVVDDKRNVSTPVIADTIESSTDGQSWISTTAATSGSYNPRIRAVRITLVGTFVASAAFRCGIGCA